MGCLCAKSGEAALETPLIATPDRFVELSISDHDDENTPKAAEQTDTYSSSSRVSSTSSERFYSDLGEEFDSDDGFEDAQAIEAVQEEDDDSTKDVASPRPYCWSEFEPVKILSRSRQHRAGGSDVVFVITRSSNANSVIYKAFAAGADNGAKLDDGSAPDVGPEGGVHAFWIMFHKSKAPTEGLTFLETNTAYGTEVNVLGKNHFQVRLSALARKSIEVMLEDGEWCARTAIGGQEGRRLLAVHVEMAKSFVPKVAYVEIFGDNWSYELIEKIKGSGKLAQAKADEHKRQA